MENLINDAKNVIMNTYNRFPIVIEKGEGVYCYDNSGKKYLDFVAGIATNSLGHGNKKLVEAISYQANKLIHVSNLYYTKPQVDLAKLLVKYTDLDKVFFCNSGAEAIEGALKLCRKYAYQKKNGKFEIIAMENSFHGRTYAAITATGQKKYQEGLDPLMPGISHIPFNDINAFKSAVNEKTCAVIVEPIQGEGGIIVADGEYLKELRKICDEKDILLIYDEVQTGVGRTGKLFAYMHDGVVPDILCTAKGLAGGVPIGAILAKDNVADGFKPGDHASTFGGNPLATAAGAVVIKEIMENGLLENVNEQGSYLKEKLNLLKSKKSSIIDTRGMGLIQCIELSMPPVETINKLIENGLLTVGAGGNTIRFVPPLIIEKEHIDEAFSILDKALS